MKLAVSHARLAATLAGFVTAAMLLSLWSVETDGVKALYQRQLFVEGPHLPETLAIEERADIPLLLVIGIFSKANLQSERMAHRQTWLQSPWICNQKSIPPSNGDDNNRKQEAAPRGANGYCVHVYFVIGRVLEVENAQLIQRENATYGDILELDIQENMNQGKSTQFLLQAAKWFPRASFIAKSDMDTYVMIDRLAADIAEIALGGKHIYGGRLVDYRLCGSTPNKCPIGWVYMAGQFYFLSQDLVQYVALPNNEVTKANFGGTSEDLQLGKLLRQSGLAVMYFTWPAEREPWLHHKNLTYFYDFHDIWPTITYTGLVPAPPFH